MLRRPSDTRKGKVGLDYRTADGCGGAMIGGEGKDILLGGDNNYAQQGGGGNGLPLVGDGDGRLRGGDGADAFIFAAVDNVVDMEADDKTLLPSRTSRTSTSYSPCTIFTRSEAMSFSRSATIRSPGLKTWPSASSVPGCSSSSKDLEPRSRQVFHHPPRRHGSAAAIRRSRQRNWLLPRPGFRKSPIGDRKSAIKDTSAPVSSIPAGKLAPIRCISKMPPLSRAPSMRSNVAMNPISAKFETTFANAQKTGRVPILRPDSDVEGQRFRTSPAEAKSTPRHGTLSDELGQAGKPTTRRT